MLSIHVSIRCLLCEELREVKYCSKHFYLIKGCISQLIFRKTVICAISADFSQLGQEYPAILHSLFHYNCLLYDRYASRDQEKRPLNRGFLK